MWSGKDYESSMIIHPIVLTAEKADISKRDLLQELCCRAMRLGSTQEMRPGNLRHHYTEKVLPSQTHQREACTRFRMSFLAAAFVVHSASPSEWPAASCLCWRGSTAAYSCGQASSRRSCLSVLVFPR